MAFFITLFLFISLCFFLLWQHKTISTSDILLVSLTTSLISSTCLVWLLSQFSIITDYSTLNLVIASSFIYVPIYFHSICSSTYVIHSFHHLTISLMYFAIMYFATELTTTSIAFRLYFVYEQNSSVPQYSMIDLVYLSFTLPSTTVLIKSFISGVSALINVSVYTTERHEEDKENLKRLNTTRSTQQEQLSKLNSKRMSGLKLNKDEALQFVLLTEESNRIENKADVFEENKTNWLPGFLLKILSYAAVFVTVLSFSLVILISVELFYYKATSTCGIFCGFASNKESKINAFLLSFMDARMLSNFVTICLFLTAAFGLSDVKSSVGAQLNFLVVTFAALAADVTFIKPTGNADLASNPIKNAFGSNPLAETLYLSLFALSPFYLAYKFKNYN